MATSIIHPSELAYAMVFARAETLIGWGSDPFLPAGPGDGEPADWLAAGEARLVAAGRLTGRPEAGLNFTDDHTAAMLALVNPGLVLLAQRRAGDGVQTQTIHAGEGAIVGLVRQSDGLFEMETYEDLTAAAAASAAFLGADAGPLAERVRIETDAAKLDEVKRLAGSGQTGAAEAGLRALGAGEAAARSAVAAMAAPAAAGVLSLLYTRANAVEEAEALALLTNAAGETWVVVTPEGPEGPVILERASVAALAARVGVDVAVRLMPAA